MQRKACDWESLKFVLAISGRFFSGSFDLIVSDMLLESVFFGCLMAE
jgi:hypothetical protein